MNKHTKQKNFSTIRKRSHVLGLKIPSLLSTTFCNFFIKISVQPSAMYNICFNLELENAGLNVFLVIFIYYIKWYYCSKFYGNYFPKSYTYL